MKWKEKLLDKTLLRLGSPNCIICMHTFCYTNVHQVHRTNFNKSMSVTQLEHEKRHTEEDHSIAALDSSQ